VHPILAMGLKFVAVYALLYAAFGVQSPFLPAILRDRGLRPEEIGAVLATSTAIRVVAGPVMGHTADRLRIHALMLCGCSLMAALTGLGYLVIQGFWQLLLVALAHAVMLAPIVPISDALATSAANGTRQRQRLEYGRLRASGSAAFIVGTAIAGSTTGEANLASAMWVSGALLVAGGAAALCLPGIRAGPTQSSGIPAATLSDFTSLLRLAVFRRMLAVAALVEGSHALHDTFAVIRWRAAGINLMTISALWSESVLSEIFVFLMLGPRLIRWLAPGGACALAAGAGIVRWTVAAVTTSPVLLGAVQPLHGLTFALLHLACMRLIVGIVPLRLAATAQSIYGTLCIGSATALLTLVSGWLYERMGGAAFLVMAALCLTALPMCAGLRLSRS
jgi:PPP family 3-phenylpropionic acid transporter